MKRLGVFVLVALGMSAGQADAAPLLKPVTKVPALRMRTARHLAARWADDPYPVMHDIRCRRRNSRVITCTIRYHDVALPVDVWEHGHWVTTYGDAVEHVRVVRRRHRTVLTSDLLLGQMSQRS